MEIENGLILFFFGRRRLKRRSEKTEVPGRKGNTDSFQKKGDRKWKMDISHLGWLGCLGWLGSLGSLGSLGWLGWLGWLGECERKRARASAGERGILLAGWMAGWGGEF